MSENPIRGLRNISIKNKLTLIIMVSSTVALLLISGAFVAYELITFKQSMRAELSGLAKFIAVQNDGALLYDKNEDAYDSLGALSAKPHIVLACLYNKKGEIFATYPRNISKPLLPQKPARDGSWFEKDTDHLRLFQSIVKDGDTIGTVYLESDLKELHQRLLQYGGIILLFMLTSSLVTLFLSSFLRRIISDPISRLAESAKAVSEAQNYSVRAVKQSQDELGQFVDVFNEMLAQIQKRDAALQQAQGKLEKRVEERTRDLQAEIAERQRTQEALQQQLSRISLLNQITQVISERQDLASILQVVLRQLEDHLPVDLGSVYLREPEGEMLGVAALREKNPRTTALAAFPATPRISLEQSGLGPCQQGGTVYLAETAQLDTPLARHLAGAGFHCAVAVPLVVEGKIFGIMVVARQAGKSFSSGECEFLRSLSEHVALAAHQAQLHTQLEVAYNDLRQSQASVMQQDRLRALGQMASGIAHDVNNALSPVVGFAGLLLEYEPNLSPSARKHLNYIKTAGGDVAHIVARMREFYRPREGQEKLFPVNLSQLAEQVIDMTRPRWRDIPQGRGIMVEMQNCLDSELPDVLGIASEVREALTNLVLNAVDAMPQGGKLMVNTRVRTGAVGGKGAPASPTYCCLEVVDSGTGMNEETLKHCLEPFYSTKGKRGTGLGLAMVYGVMERHEGKIEIESQLGRGTTVRLIFPVQTQKSSLSPGEPKIPGPVVPLQILCIDDEPMLRELVKDMLERDGHQVQVADSGRTGLDAFHSSAQRGRPFDVVVTDLGMPYMDGLEVAKTLKIESPGTPVILLTGWGAFMKSDGELPPDVHAVLSKPPRSTELREILSGLKKN